MVGFADHWRWSGPSYHCYKLTAWGERQWHRSVLHLKVCTNDIFLYASFPKTVPLPVLRHLPFDNPHDTWELTRYEGRSCTLCSSFLQINISSLSLVTSHVCLDALNASPDFWFAFLSSLIPCPYLLHTFCISRCENGLGMNHIFDCRMRVSTCLVLLPFDHLSVPIYLGRYSWTSSRVTCTETPFNNFRLLNLCNLMNVIADILKWQAAYMHDWVQGTCSIYTSSGPSTHQVGVESMKLELDKSILSYNRKIFVWLFGFVLPHAVSICFNHVWHHLLKLGG